MPIHGFPGNVISATPPSVTPAGASGVFTTEQQMQYQTAGNWPMAATQISRSLRFNSADTAYLNRTPASATNRKTWTWSGWTKKCNFTAYKPLFYADAGGNTNCQIQFLDTNILRVFQQVAGVDTYYLITTQVFRDSSAWYHVVCAVDTTQATASNRLKLYINGTQITAFSSTLYPSQNYDGTVNSNVAHYIGTILGGPYYYDGYLTEINFIDGYALTPASFGQTNSNTGIWEPRQYTGPYGTNGFYLNFSDNSGTTSTTLGKDYSGNGNNWTPNNFSVTAGAGNDSLVDTPTPYGTDTGVGGEVRGNYCTLNPLIATATLSNGNLDFSQTNTKTAASMGVTSGKWYCEATCNTTANRLFIVGVAKVGDNSAFNLFASGVGYYADNGEKYVDGTTSAYGATYTAGDIIGIALNMDAGTVTFYKNNTSQGSINLPTSSQGYYPLAIQAASGSTSATWTANFGQRPFAYTAPSGFKALCTQNLPTPTIGATSTTQAGKYFNPVLYSGNSSTQNITGVGFAPDFTWLKVRNDAQNHRQFDTVRGANQRLMSSSTAAEATTTNELTAFGSDGFTLGANTDVNGTGFNYVSWNWNAGGSNATNTSGTITSTVRANTTSGFSVVRHTGTGALGTIGHGLGVAPAMFISKNLANGSTNWHVYHQSIGNTAAVFLNLTDAAITSVNYFNNTSPTSTVFTLASAINLANSYITYCFAPVAGYSAFGSYTGNGSSTNGPFIYTGFRPALIMMKASGATGAWTIFDSKRNPSNGATFVLQPNSSAAEGTFTSSEAPDLLSNGFRLNFSYADYNSNGVAYIYAAFAEFPFKYTLAR